MTPLLIRAAGRTGTTLLLNLLKSSPQILVRGGYPFEERLLSYFYRLSAVPFAGQVPTPESLWTHESINAPCPLIGRYPGREPIVSNGEVGQHQILCSLWEGYLNARMKSGEINFAYLAEKTNHDVAKINDYLFCKNIFLIRDPRDQLVSIREFDRKRGFKGFGLASGEGSDSIVKLCDSVRDMFKLASEIQAGEEKRILIRYEDLVQNRDACLLNLSNWLSVSFDLDLFEKENMQYRSGHSTAPNQQESIGRWKSYLTKEEVAIFHERLTPYMESLGYF